VTRSAASVIPAPAGIHPAARRIALLGAESTGKSWLANELAAQLRSRGLRAIAVPEALRTWCERAGRAPRPEEQLAIAQEQERSVDAAGLEADVVIADTTALMVAIYAGMLYEDGALYRFALERQRSYDATLLTGLDLPWIPAKRAASPASGRRAGGRGGGRSHRRRAAAAALGLGLRQVQRPRLRTPPVRAAACRPALKAGAARNQFLSFLAFLAFLLLVFLAEAFLLEAFFGVASVAVEPLVAPAAPPVPAAPGVVAGACARAKETARAATRAASSLFMVLSLVEGRQRPLQQRGFVVDW
jgi:nicotinamide riboside kinase